MHEHVCAFTSKFCYQFFFGIEYEMHEEIKEKYVVKS